MSASRLELLNSWVDQYCEFLKVSRSDVIVNRIYLSVMQLDDDEVEEELLMSC